MTEELTETLENTGNDQDKTEKKFSQADVDKIVKDRLAREKATALKVREELDSYKSTVEAELNTYKGLVEKQLETLTKDVPENIKKLLDKLTPLERLEWLSNPDNKVEKAKIPSTPQEKGENKEFKPHKVDKLF